MPSILDLPAEAHYLIFSHLLTPYPNSPLTFRTVKEKLDNPPANFRDHPFYELAASCRDMRDAVEDYCEHLGKVYSTVMEGPSTSAGKNKKRKISSAEEESERTQGVFGVSGGRTEITRGTAATAAGAGAGAAGLHKDTPRRRRKGCFRKKWVKFACANCLFCGRPSTRRAILNARLNCCKGCDRVEWPDKITLTEASSRYAMHKDQLYQLAGPQGGYHVMGGWTTMFLRAEVERAANTYYAAQGGWKSHLELREADVERRRKERERRVKDGTLVLPVSRRRRLPANVNKK
ncbi:MAG: hypothetical protein M1819_005450 [Sarea resinae]|nr:MAG: hypothetical protein M1819_005450 [Sarea resinae]